MLRVLFCPQVGIEDGPRSDVLSASFVRIESNCLCQLERDVVKRGTSLSLMTGNKTSQAPLCGDDGSMVLLHRFVSRGFCLIGN